MKQKKSSMKEGVIVKTLGEVCDFKIGATPSRRKK